MQGYAQYEGNERCGVLTGSQIGDNLFRISKVSPPCVAHNSRFGCERDSANANYFIKHDYEYSEHTRVYVGEWHTHPEKNPSPSGTDYDSIIDNYFSSDISVPFLMMILVGTESINFSVYNGAEFVAIEPQIIE